MGLFTLIFKDLFKPAYLVGGIVRWVVEFRHEVILFASSAVFVFFVFLSSSLARVNSIYYRYLHRGIWEDVMISLPYSADLPSLKELAAKLGGQKRSVLQEGSSSEFKALEKALFSLLDEDIKYLVAGKKVMASVRLEGLEINGKDMSSIHGQFDLWIKSTLFESGESFGNTSIPKGSVVLSKCLARKLCFEIPQTNGEAIIRFGRWKSLFPVYSFKVLGLVDVGGGINVIYMNSKDLPKLGLTTRYNFVGMNVGALRPGEVKSLLEERLGSPYLVKTPSDIEDTRVMKIFIIMIGIATVFLALIIIINAWFSSLHGFERRRDTVYLVSFYGYEHNKAASLFALLNMLPALLGICASVCSIFLDWPIHLSQMLLKPVNQLGLDLNLWDLLMAPFFLGVVGLLVLFYFALGFGLFVFHSDGKG